MAIGLLNVFLVSALLGLEAVGLFVFYVSLQQIVAFAATLGVSSYSVRVLNRTVNQRRVALTMTAHLAAVLCLFLIIGIVHWLITADLGVFALLLLTCWVGVVRYMIEDLCAGLGWFVRSSVTALLENSLRSAMILTLGFHDARGVLVVLAIAAATASTLVGIGALRHCASLQGGWGGVQYLRAFYAASLLMFSSHATALIQSRIGVLAAPLFLGKAEVGVFGLLLSISEIALRAGGMVARFIYARASGRSSKAMGVSPDSLVRSVAIVGVLVSLVTLILFPVLSRYFQGGALVEYFPSFGILSAYAATFLYFNLSSNLLYGAGLSRNVLKSSVAGIAVSAIALVAASAFESFVGLCVAVAAGASTSALWNAHALRVRVRS
jgi:O-antigen/teichoic acid export membrane protein